jgi:hypothetical protein
MSSSEDKDVKIAKLELKAQAQPTVAVVSPAGTESAPTMPKVKSIESQTAIPSNPFAGGAPAQITINLPQDLGKVADLLAQFTMTFSTTDTSGCDIAVVPSPFFVDFYQVSRRWSGSGAH